MKNNPHRHIKYAARKIDRSDPHQVEWQKRITRLAFFSQILDTGMGYALHKDLRQDSKERLIDLLGALKAEVSEWEAAAQEAETRED